jgi:hypothetical protein
MPAIASDLAAGKPERLQQPGLGASPGRADQQQVHHGGGAEQRQHDPEEQGEVNRFAEVD